MMLLIRSMCFIYILAYIQCDSACPWLRAVPGTWQFLITTGITSKAKREISLAWFACSKDCSLSSRTIHCAFFISRHIIRRTMPIFGAFRHFWSDSLFRWRSWVLFSAPMKRHCRSEQGAVRSIFQGASTHVHFESSPLLQPFPSNILFWRDLSFRFVGLQAQQWRDQGFFST